VGRFVSLTYKPTEDNKMKNSVKYILILVSLLALLALAAAPQQGPSCTNLVLGGVCTLSEGDSLSGGMVVLGGSATLENGSTLEGDVVVMGGSLRSNGTIEGDAVVLGGLIDLGDSAVVEGSAVAIGGNVQRAPGARVEGDVVSDVDGIFPFIIPGIIQIPNWDGAPSIIVPGEVPQVNVRVNPFWDVLWVLVRSFLWAFLAVLVVLFLPRNAERTASAVVAQPLASGGLGCATTIVVPILLVALAITICGIPISLVGFFLLIVGWAFGVIVVGMEVGRRLAQLLKQDWALPVSAGLGTFGLTLVSNSIGALLPCFGWLAPALIGCLGLGAVLLTRFGSQNYPLDFVPPAPRPPAPPAPPAPELEEPDVQEGEPMPDAALDVAQEDHASATNPEESEA
jgi:hypothetical protein